MDRVQIDFSKVIRLMSNTKEREALDQLRAIISQFECFEPGGHEQT